MKKVISIIVFLLIAAAAGFYAHNLYNISKGKEKVNEYVDKIVNVKKDVEEKDKKMEEQVNALSIDKNINEIVHFTSARKDNYAKALNELSNIKKPSDKKAKELEKKIEETMTLKMELFDDLLTFYKNDDVDQKLTRVIEEKTINFQKKESEIESIINNQF